jgi:hypothetical protein
MRAQISLMYRYFRLKEAHRSGKASSNKGVLPVRAHAKKCLGPGTDVG